MQDEDDVESNNLQSPRDISNSKGTEIFFQVIDVFERSIRSSNRCARVIDVFDLSVFSSNRCVRVIIMFEISMC